MDCQEKNEHSVQILHTSVDECLRKKTDKRNTPPRPSRFHAPGHERQMRSKWNISNVVDCKPPDWKTTWLEHGKFSKNISVLPSFVSYTFFRPMCWSIVHDFIATIYWSISMQLSPHLSWFNFCSSHWIETRFVTSRVTLKMCPHIWPSTSYLILISELCTRCIPLCTVW